MLRNVSGMHRLRSQLTIRFRTPTLAGLSQRRSITYYDVLKVKRNCPDARIRTAYLELSKQNHPDLNPNNPQKHAEFLKIKEAYDVLRKRSSRRDYDLSLSNQHASWHNSQTRTQNWPPPGYEHTRTSEPPHPASQYGRRAGPPPGWEGGGEFGSHSHRDRSYWEDRRAYWDFHSGKSEFYDGPLQPPYKDTRIVIGVATFVVLWFSVVYYRIRIFPRNMRAAVTKRNRAISQSMKKNVDPETGQMLNEKQVEIEEMRRISKLMEAAPPSLALSQQGSSSRR